MSNDKRVTINEDVPANEHGSLGLLSLVGAETPRQAEQLRELRNKEQPDTVQDWYLQMGMLQPE
jgi:hypothetical protein